MTLYEVPGPVDIPLTISKPRLAAHARRVADLARLFTAALPAIPDSEQAAFADIIPLGVSLSHARDLGIIPLNTRAGFRGRLRWWGSPRRSGWSAAPTPDPLARTGREAYCQVVPGE